MGTSLRTPKAVQNAAIFMLGEKMISPHGEIELKIVKCHRLRENQILTG